MKKAIAEERFQAREEFYYETQVHNFQYDLNGPTVAGASGNYILRETLMYSSGAGAIIQSVRDSTEYQVAYDALLSTFLSEQVRDYQLAGHLDNAVNHLTQQMLADPPISGEGVKAYWWDLSQSLLGEARAYTVELALNRVVVLSAPLSFRIDGYGSVVLRPVSVDDLQQAIPIREIVLGNVTPLAMGMGALHGSLPAAVLTIECEAHDQAMVQRRIEETLAILRLYSPAAVDVVTQRFWSSGRLNQASGGGLWLSGLERYFQGFGQYIITDENAGHFIQFWQKLIPHLPQGLSDRRREHTDYLTIAYDRYCDALLKGALFEERLASAVMGLEALLLSSKPQGELKFRLGVNAAKLLSGVGYDGEEVRATISKAYDIRSLYVHGSICSARERKNLCDTYGREMMFVEKVVDLLRATIIVFAVTGVDKEALLHTAQGALISVKQQTDLAEKLRSARDILTVS